MEFRRQGIDIPEQIWILIFVLGLCIRIAQVTFWSHWPSLDESVFDYFSLQLSSKWTWKPFWGAAQHPPVFNWLLALFFKVLGPSLESARLFSLLSSASVLTITYFFVRFLPANSFSVFLFFGMALGFWPLYVGQFCLFHILFLFWEVLCLGLLVLSLRPRAGASYLIFFLGIATGFGFFVDIAWPVVAVVIALVVFYAGNKGRRTFFSFLGFSAVFVGLFVLVCVWGNYGERIRSLWFLDGDSNGHDQIKNSLENVSAILWGGDAACGPTWGGMLNPIGSSLFFFGLLSLKHLKGRSWIKEFCGLSLLLLLPGLVSKSFDIMRILQILPFVLLLTALGFHRLISFFAGKTRILIFSIILIASALLDIRHLHIQRSVSPFGAEESEAYDILKHIARQEGPGILFPNLRPSLWDKSLLLATYPFNAAYNKDGSLKNAKWASMIVNGNYKPFLSGDPRLNIHWYLLGQDPLWNYGGLLLAVFPLDAKNQPLITQWSAADHYFEDLSSRIIDTEASESKEDMEAELLQPEKVTQGDPFLETCFCEKEIFAIPTWDRKNLLSDIQRGCKNGYALPNFLVVQGVLLGQMGLFQESRRAFRQALRSGSDASPAAEYLKDLDSEEKQKRLKGIDPGS